VGFGFSAFRVGASFFIVMRFCSSKRRSHGDNKGGGRGGGGGGGSKGRTFLTKRISGCGLAPIWETPWLVFVKSNFFGCLWRLEWFQERVAHCYVL
jgi:hypothetical protein